MIKIMSCQKNHVNYLSIPHLPHHRKLSIHIHMIRLISDPSTDIKSRVESTLLDQIKII